MKTAEQAYNEWARGRTGLGQKKGFEAGFKAGQHSDWVRVEDGLPEPGKQLWLWFNHSINPVKGCYCDNAWLNDYDNLYNGTPTHWMYALPQPPKTEQE